MTTYGFLRVAAATPLLRVADCAYNAEQILALMRRAQDEGVRVLVFPELCITGYTCADLFQHGTLQHGALDALGRLVEAGAQAYSGLAVVGLPLAVDDQVFNCAAVLHRGHVLGVVPKSFIPNYKEFYEGRWFAAAATARSREVRLLGAVVPFGTDRLFAAEDVEGLTVGVEVCEDLWVPIPPSSAQALAGATVLVNLSASNEVIGKAAYRRQLVVNQSGRCMAAYVYSSCGPLESTTDVVFGGHCLVAENGTLLAESRRFPREPALLVADVDLDRLRADRVRTNSFGDAKLYVGMGREFERAAFRLDGGADRDPFPGGLRREVEAHPFVPRGQEQLRERCEDIFQTQVAGLAKRLEHIGKPPVAIGISGGLDSTLALLVTCKTLDALGVPRDRIRALTMPGFGTTGRTRDNARALMRQLGVTAREVDIRPLCLEEMRALNHRPFGIALDGLSVEELTERLRRLPPDGREDLTFENVQARMRTSLLMNTGFVIGTGDVSELALGWCTYNGDHMSMYNPNSSIPKTLVKFLVEWAARNEFEGEARLTLLDVVDTLISPELLPTDAHGQAQATEGAIGPYELHDFFLYHFLRYGAPPDKILFLAACARFDRPYTADELRRWLQVFVRRFFANQFKRSCLPDGPKVGSISLSPRGDWRMPSDAQAALWLCWADGPPPASEQAARPA
ncbi:MAG TPA: NAD(+) synthase [Gemmataceae bacterium]|jgi:NAD+ synthase (glutamine-hydrolysing)|nr:NAD(+) synthase [Gemmataceae bacterium]